MSEHCCVVEAGCEELPEPCTCRCMPCVAARLPERVGQLETGLKDFRRLLQRTDFADWKKSGRAEMIARIDALLGESSR